MIKFERKLSLDLIRNSLRIGDYTSGKFGGRILITNIVSVEIEGEYVIIKGFGMEQ